MLQLGSKVAVATVTDAGKFEWWSRCVQQMKRKSAGKSVGMSPPLRFVEAKSSQLQVICSWYSKRASMCSPMMAPLIPSLTVALQHGVVLGLLDFELPDDQGRYPRG